MTVLAEAVEHLVRGIVDHPDDVSVRSRALRRGKILDVRVHPDDLGRVIGRSGRTAGNLRTIVDALGAGQHHRVEFEAHGAARRSRRNGSAG